jgi:O-glycosyl hydrolase
MHLLTISLVLATVAIATTTTTAPKISTRNENEEETQIPRITLSLNHKKQYQEIAGFGFSEAFQRANAIRNLPEPHREDVLRLLFDRGGFRTEKSAGFTILRLGLGSSADGRGDRMNSPQAEEGGGFAWDGVDSGQVWVAREALRVSSGGNGGDGGDGEREKMQFIADAWSAPGYMKTNGRDDMGGWLCGVRGEGKEEKSCKGVSWVGAYAEYLARYVKAWVDAGISIGHVGFLNEPNLM